MISVTNTQKKKENIPSVTVENSTTPATCMCKKTRLSYAIPRPSCPRAPRRLRRRRRSWLPRTCRRRLRFPRRRRRLRLYWRTSRRILIKRRSVSLCPADSSERLWGKDVRTLDFRVVALRLAHEEGSGLAIQGVCRVGIPQQLREEDLEDVYHIEHGRPRLVDDVQAH